MAALAVAGLAVGLALFGPWSSGRGKRAGPGAGAGPSATVRAQAGAMGDAPSADPCQVLGAASLSRFGQTELTPS
ncbi:hypothetical protein BIV25_09880 [Streptomyces sp. MUSC 14]|nr:hypothetical protein BIV25_09880 [Streptomyces sp. MUSC 14]